MENFEDNIEKQYHERFHDFEEMPDDALWNKIQERIAPESEPRPVVFWWKNFRQIGVAASLLLGLLLGGYYFSTFSKKKTEQMSDVTVKKATNKNVKSSIIKQNTEKKILQNNHVIDKQKQGIIVDKLEKNSNQIELIDKQKQGIIADKLEKNVSQIQVIDKQKQVLELIRSEESVVEKKPFIAENSLPIPNKISELAIITKKDLNEVSSKKQVDEVLLNTAKNTQMLDNKVLVQEKEHLKKNTHTPILVDNGLGNPLYDGRQILVEKIDLTYLSSKKANFQVVEKPINAPEINVAEPIIAFEDFPKRKLVFIPPTEVFVNVTPMLNYYAFSPNNQDNILVKNLSSSPQRLGFAAQFGFVYPITKRLDLRTGLSFMTGKSKISYGLTNTEQRNVRVIDALNIEIEPTQSTVMENRNWQYIELQSDLLYQIKQFHALSLGFRAGVQPNALNKPIFNGRVGYRISKPISNRVALWVEPSMSISLSSQRSIENLFIYRTTGFGLNMGVSLLRQ